MGIIGKTWIKRTEVERVEVPRIEIPRTQIERTEIKRTEIKEEVLTIKLSATNSRGYRCHFCGETRSVKYILELFEPDISKEPMKVPCCNRCALLHAVDAKKQNNSQNLHLL